MGQTQQSRTQVTRDELRVHGLMLPIELRRHPSARRLTLRVSHTRRAVILTVPTGCCEREAGQFVSRNLAWVRSRLADLPPSVPFTDGAIIPLRGIDHDLRFCGAVRQGAVVRIVDAEQRRTGAGEERPRLDVSGYAENAPRRLRDWLQGQARRDIERAVGLHARNLDLRPRRISIRDQTTRWGSCSSSGALSFSWRLVLAPRYVLSYLAAHEVAHLQEMNHGERFWELVRMTMPRMEEAQTWLRSHGAHLHSIGCKDDDSVPIVRNAKRETALV